MKIQEWVQQLEKLEKELDRLESVLSAQMNGNIQDWVHSHQRQLEEVERELKKTSLMKKDRPFKTKSVV